MNKKKLLVYLLNEDINMLKEHINLNSNFEVLYWISYNIDELNNNENVCNEERKHKPDIIIIGIPNAILPYSKNRNFNFGIGAYEILNAIQSDYNILSLPNGEYNDDYYKDIENLCKYRYDISLDSIFISQFVPISTTTESIEFIFSKTEEKVNKSNIIPTYNTKALENNKFFNDIVDVLEEYLEIELF